MPTDYSQRSLALKIAEATGRAAKKSGFLKDALWSFGFQGECRAAFEKAWDETVLSVSAH